MNEQEMADLKAKYGKITTVTIPLDEDDETKVLTYHLRKPDMMSRKMIAKLSSLDNFQKAVIAGYNALRVAGDEVTELEKNDDALLSAQEALITVLEVQKATIKKN
jgi:hypothetical protein